MILGWVIVWLCLAAVNCYFAELNTSTTTSSITDYYQDFAACECDLTPNLCDNYCCCDPICSSSTTVQWTASALCMSTPAQLESLCSQNGGQGTFKDLACIYYSNKGSIGYYYQYPSTVNINYPTPALFEAVGKNVKTAKATLTAALNSMGLGSAAYSATNQYVKTKADEYLLLPLPGLGGKCTAGTINLTSSANYSCSVTPTKQNCANLSDDYIGASQICQKGNYCNTSFITFSPLVKTIPLNTTCDNVLESITVNLTLISVGTAYQLTSASVIFGTPVSKSLGQTANIAVKVIVNTAAVAVSGSPGYQIGKAIKLVSPISVIGDPDGNCLPAAGGNLAIAFGVAQTFSCRASSPCTTSYYVDSIGKSTISIQKYASKSSDTITVIGTSATLNTCKSERIQLNLIYSRMGWELDPQYYVVGGSLTTLPTPDSTEPSQKFLQINWIYADPLTVSTPPTNTFYTYFSNLWTPLKDRFGIA